MNRLEDKIVYVLDPEEDRNLRAVLEMYVLNLNAQKSMDLGRSLEPEEKFLANKHFANVLDAAGVSREHWWSRLPE